MAADIGQPRPTSGPSTGPTSSADGRGSPAISASPASTSSGAKSGPGSEAEEPETSAPSEGVGYVVEALREIGAREPGQHWGSMTFYECDACREVIEAARRALAQPDAETREGEDG